MSRKLLMFSLIVLAGFGLAWPAAAQIAPGIGLFPAPRHDRPLILAAMRCAPGQDFSAAEDRCVPKGQAKTGGRERCPPGQRLDPALNRCIAPPAPAAAVPPAAAPPAAAPSTASPATASPATAGAPAATPPSSAAPSSGAPAAAVPAAAPAAPASSSCPAGQQFDARLRACVPSTTGGGAVIPRSIPGDPLKR